MFKKKKNNFWLLIVLSVLSCFLFLHNYISTRVEFYAFEYSANEIEYFVINTLNRVTLADMEANSEDYIDICNIIQNDSNDIIAVSTDTFKINKIKNRINIACDDVLENNDMDTVYVPFGSLTNDVFLFNTGIDIPIKMDPMTTTKVEFASSFESTGINQTIHKIIIECTVYVTILTPFDRCDFETVHKIAISETVLMGNVPESYTYININ